MSNKRKYANICQNMSSHTLSSFETVVLHPVGWGGYHNMFTLLSAMYSFTMGIASMAVPIAVPVAACDLNLTTNEVLLVHVAYTLGMSVGSWAVGCLSDIYERKRMIPVTFLNIFVCCFICGFATESVMFSVFIFLIGFGITANMAVVKINFAENLPIEKRGAYIVFLDFIWIVGFLLSSVPVLFFHPNKPIKMIDGRIKKQWHYVTWRLMFGAITAICMVLSCSTALLQMNVRSLLVKKRRGSALLTLKYMFALNNSQHADNYKLQMRDLQGFIKELPSREIIFESFKQHFRQQMEALSDLYRHMCVSSYIKIIVLISIIRINLFGGFLMNSIWVARIMSCNVTSTDCNLSTVDLVHLKNEACFERVSHQFYIDFVACVVLGAITGTVLLIFLIDRIGRRIFLALGFLICGITSILLSFFQFYSMRFILSVIYMMAFAFIQSTLDVILIESVPTLLRGTAFGISYFPCGLILAILKYFLHTPCNISFLFIGSTMFAASVFGCFLPDLKMKPMVE